MIKIKNTTYSIEEFETICIKYDNRHDISVTLECSYNTLTSAIKKYYPELTEGFSNRVSLGSRVLRLKNLKRCTKCSTIKSLQEFNIDNHTSDKRKGKCRDCTKKESNTFYQNNKDLYYTYKANRRAAILNRTPKWADLEKIKEIYDKCPKGYEVDHIIPLQGKTVSGLHIAENLQYLTPEDNRQKSNKYKDE